MPMKRPGFWVPTLRLGASKKKTSSSTIGATSRKTFIRPEYPPGELGGGCRLEFRAPGWESILVAFAAVSRLAGVASIRHRDGMRVIGIRPVAGLQYFCNAAFMQTAITITRRGVITLPARLRRALGLRAEDQLIAEVTPEGLLLRPAVTLPVEVYSKERVREFDEAEQELAESLRAQPAPGRAKPARKRAARRGR